MSPAQRAAQEILELFTKAQTGVVYVNEALFDGKSAEQIKIIKERVAAVIGKHRC